MEYSIMGRLPLQYIQKYETEDSVKQKSKNCLDESQIDGLIGLAKINSSLKYRPSNIILSIAKSLSQLAASPTVQKAQMKKRQSWALIKIYLHSTIQKYLIEELSAFEEKVKKIIEALIIMFNQYLVDRNKSNEVLTILVSNITQCILMVEGGEKNKKVEYDFKKILEQGIFLENFVLRLPEFFELFLRIRYEILTQELNPRLVIESSLKKLYIQYQKKLTLFLNWIAIYVFLCYAPKYFDCHSLSFSCDQLNQQLNEILTFIGDTIQNQHLIKIDSPKGEQTLFMMVRWDVIPNLLLFKQVVGLESQAINQKVHKILSMTIKALPTELWPHFQSSTSMKIVCYITKLCGMKSNLTSKSELGSFVEINQVPELKYLRQQSYEDIAKNPQSFNILDIYLYFCNLLKLQKKIYQSQIQKVWSHSQLLKIFNQFIFDLTYVSPSINLFILYKSFDILIGFLEDPAKYIKLKQFLNILEGVSNIFVLLCQPKQGHICYPCRVFSGRMCHCCEVLCSSYQTNISDETKKYYSLSMLKSIDRFQEQELNRISNKFKGSITLIVTKLFNDLSRVNN